MQKIEEHLEKSCLPEGMLALDIETAGFSRERDPVFLVGALLGGTEFDTFFQWIHTSDSPEEEVSLLRAIRPVLAAHPILTYNGDAFDLPFLAHRARRHNLTWPEMESVDLYRALRQKKKMLNLPNLKLETVERALGIHRSDVLSGGEVAALFRRLSLSACGMEEESAVRALLLHNREDVLYTAELLAFWQNFCMQRRFFFTPGALPPTAFQLEEAVHKKDFIYLYFSLNPPFITVCEMENQQGRLEIQQEQAVLRLPVQEARFEKEKIVIAVAPDSLSDRSPYQLRRPLLCLCDRKRIYVENCLAYAQTFLRTASFSEIQP
uniref:ribonuclease H-like domain-containing protein n=1 Tax=Ndongobacter massiliensis TaxID=1871025 RepID=UPI000930AF3C|nr:ribonuclease H-like domain-containing protein [Ndongobacter massiliensis]